MTTIPGERLKLARRRVGCSQRELARLSHTSRHIVRHVENGHSWPGSYHVREWVLALRGLGSDVTADWLLGIEFAPPIT